VTGVGKGIGDADNRAVDKGLFVRGRVLRPAAGSLPFTDRSGHDLLAAVDGDGGFPDVAALVGDEILRRGDVLGKCRRADGQREND